MTYSRKIRFSLSIDETLSDDDDMPSLPPQPSADVVETTGELIAETIRPLRKCAASSRARKAG